VIAAGPEGDALTGEGMDRFIRVTEFGLDKHVKSETSQTCWIGSPAGGSAHQGCYRREAGFGEERLKGAAARCTGK
jgi:hypothetical protein